MFVWGGSVRLLLVSLSVDCDGSPCLARIDFPSIRQVALSSVESLQSVGGAARCPLCTDWCRRLTRRSVSKEIAKGSWHNVRRTRLHAGGEHRSHWYEAPKLDGVVFGVFVVM